MTDTNASECCVKACARPATIRQPLLLDTQLEVHVPLCVEHSQAWEAFARQLCDARRRATRSGKYTEWLLDSALALALYPPGAPF
jgi:hypothetical protein